MVRRLRPRLAATILAALHLAFPGGALGVRPCLHHDGLATQQHAEHGAEASIVSGHAGASGHLGHHLAAHDVADGAAAHADGPGHIDAAHDDSAHDACSCLGACVAGSAVAWVAAPPAVSVSTETPDEGVSSARATPRTARLPYVLPYPTAPPALPV